MIRSVSAENKPDVMICNTFGSIRAASINQAASSSRRLSTPCSAGTVTPLNATCISRMSRPTLDANASRPSQLSWESSFRKSRWFTRGWTLQELVAPALVEFFSKEGQQLGSKRSLERHVNEVTRIPIKALRGSPLYDFSIQERMSWAENRDTTREEDKAYSLLGIFDVHMPLIYSEGREKAFKRLREEIDRISKG